jgi:acyl-CoA thioesterase-1
LAVLVLELGANDGLRGHDPATTKANLESIIDSTKVVHPDAAIVVAGMEAPPNLGSEYTAQFRQLYLDLARERGASLIPFLLEDVAGVPILNQADGIHPTPAGQRIVAANVWRVLQGVLDSLSREKGEAASSAGAAPDESRPK